QRVELLGVRIRHWPQEHGIHYAEQGRVRSDSERERDHSNKRECWILEEDSQRIPEVLQKSIHLSPLHDCHSEPNEESLSRAISFTTQYDCADLSQPPANLGAIATSSRRCRFLTSVRMTIKKITRISTLQLDLPWLPAALECSSPALPRFAKLKRQRRMSQDRWSAFHKAVFSLME